MARRPFAGDGEIGESVHREVGSRLGAGNRVGKGEDDSASSSEPCSGAPASRWHRLSVPIDRCASMDRITQAPYALRALDVACLLFREGKLQERADIVWAVLKKGLEMLGGIGRLAEQREGSSELPARFAIVRSKAEPLLQLGQRFAQFIGLRDQRCRTPYCDAPIRHRDHTQPYQRGGRTTAENGVGSCEHCNYAKNRPVGG